MSDFGEVRLNGRAVTIEKFSTRKVTRAFHFLGHVGSKYGDVFDEMEKFRREWGAANPVVFTRDEIIERLGLLQEQIGELKEKEDAKARAQLQTAARAWERTLNGPLKDKDRIERPGDAPFEQVVAHVIPRALENAEQEMARLLGLAVMSNEEVGEAARAGTLEDVAMGKGDPLLDTTDPDEILDLLLVAGAMLLGDIQSRRERLGKLVRLFRPAEQATETTEEEESTLSSPSPTDSAESTDGPSSTPSTGSPIPTPVASST